VVNHVNPVNKTTILGSNPLIPGTCRAMLRLLRLLRETPLGGLQTAARRQ
jgi:hypothetical protein